MVVKKGVLGKTGRAYRRLRYGDLGAGSGSFGTRHGALMVVEGSRQAVRDAIQWRDWIITKAGLDRLFSKGGGQ